MLEVALALVMLVAPAPPSGLAVRTVEVPRVLEAVTSPPELSGLAWAPALDRYLVVSDDTGLPARGTKHAPFLFALDRRGKLDEAPVPIEGIEKLSDAEAICAGPDGTFFLTTSHSANREGRTSEARRQVLHLSLRGRTLSVLGRLDLTTGAEKPLLELAGVAGSLDIEGLAFRDGALFIGLKSPLAENGQATVLRLDKPVAALKQGTIPKGGLTRWARLPLCRGADAQRVCQGISDLTFLPDGSLLLSANAPKGGEPDGGGSLWWARAPVGATPPALLHHFDRLKPEGVTLSPGGSVVVIFDRDRGEPKWMEVPAPGGRAPRP